MVVGSMPTEDRRRSSGPSGVRRRTPVWGIVTYNETGGGPANKSERWMMFEAPLHKGYALYFLNNPPGGREERGAYQAKEGVVGWGSV